MEKDNQKTETDEKDLESRYLNQILKTHPFMLYDDVENLKKEISYLEDRIQLLEALIQKLKNEK